MLGLGPTVLFFRPLQDLTAGLKLEAVPGSCLVKLEILSGQLTALVRN